MPCEEFSSFMAKLTYFKRLKKHHTSFLRDSYFPFLSQTMNLIGDVDVVTV